MNIARAPPPFWHIQNIKLIYNQIHLLLESTRNVILNHGNRRWVDHHLDEPRLKLR